MSYPCLAIPSLYIFELWSVSVSAVDVLADGGIYCRKCRKPPIVLIWFYTHLSILANGFSTVYPHPGRQFYFGLPPGKKSHSFESISGVLHKFWLFLVGRFLLNVIPGLIAWGIYRYLPVRLRHWQ